MPTSGLAKSFIKDAQSIRTEELPTLEDMAFTLPVFEGPPTRVSEGNGSKYENRGRTWILGYDGAQMPIQVDRITDEEVTPTIIRLTIGPETTHSSDETWEYILERGLGGWKKLSSKTIKMENKSQ